MILYVVYEGHDKFELHAVEATETKKMYLFKRSERGFGYASRIPKDDWWVAFTPEDAWARARAYRESTVRDAQDRLAREEQRLAKLKQDMEETL